MDNSKVREFYKAGVLELSKAEKELQRPHEDVVLYNACLNSRRAIHRFMSAIYLHNNQGSTTPPDSLTIEQLLQHNQPYEPTLKEIDFSQINCRCSDVLNDEEVFYCDNHAHVKTCFNIANRLMQIAAF